MIIPDGDAAWLACDALGYVAVFTTAGEGPMPDWIGKQDHEAVELLDALAAVGEAKLTVPLPDETWYRDVASSGIYAYDFCCEEYRLLAVPSVPVKVPDLPAVLATAARRTSLPPITFGLVTAFDAVRLAGSAVRTD